MLLFWRDVWGIAAYQQSGCPAVNCGLLALAASSMQQFGKFALGLAALLAVGLFVNARWGASFADPSPASKQMREQFEAIETSAGVPVDRHGCQTLRDFDPAKLFFYQCPIAPTRMDAVRSALSTRGWQPRGEGGDYVKGALLARLSCGAGGAGCAFRIETTPGTTGG